MNVPQLRFSGFDGEWRLKSLGEVVDIVGGGTPSTSDESSWGGEIPWFTPTEIKGPKYVSSSKRTITKKGLKASSAKLLPVNSVLLTTRATLGDMAIATVPVATNQGFQSLIPGSLVEGEFIYYLQPHIKKYCITNASGSTFLEISKNTLAQFELFLPSKMEQKRIVSFLSLLDKEIEKQQEKIEKLKHFKKGMMQKIFSQELRFKDDDGREFPEWKLKELKDIAGIVGGGTPSTSNEDFWNGNIPWFTPTEISSEKYVNQSKRTISEEGLKKSSAKVLPAGTILLTTRATLGDMAIATVPVTTNQGFQSIIPKENSVSEFIYYLQPLIKKHCLVNASGSTFMEISKSNLETFTTLIPSKKEQIKISSYLSALDLKIKKEEEKLMVLEEQKRGFMQGMFV